MSDAAHSPHLAHHFESMQQQKSAATLGMWVFIAQEIMFFGGLFLTYTVYRNLYPAAFVEGSHHLDLALGGFNTVVLILSSLTMALAVHAAQQSRTKQIVQFLSATLLLGLVFVVVKYFEYGAKFEHGLVPGAHFNAHGDIPADIANQVEIFFGIYFAMTGMHALHMVIGFGLLVWLIISSVRGRFSSAYYTPVEMVGLYWHFVDIIWIFLFPLLYLIGRHH